MAAVAAQRTAMKCSAIALFDYAAADADEISFSTGDEIIVTNKSNADWFEGWRLNDPTRLLGYFPANRVQVCECVAAEEALIYM